MNPYLSEILQNLLPVVGTLIGAVLSVLVAWVLKKVKEKAGLDIAASQQQQLLTALDHGIGLAEQWAASKLKTGAPVPSGAEKLDKALEFAAELAKKSGLEAKAREELTKLLEARLGLRALDQPKAE